MATDTVKKEKEDLLKTAKNLYKSQECPEDHPLLLITERLINASHNKYAEIKLSEGETNLMKGSGIGSLLALTLKEIGIDFHDLSFGDTEGTLTLNLNETYK